MNPIVKNIALKLCDTAPACVLEILFETLIKTWNEYVREFNLPFKKIDVADLKGVTMDQEKSRNNDSRNIYPNDASKNMNSGGISTGPDEQTFFDYFRPHIQSLNYKPPLNNSFNGIDVADLKEVTMNREKSRNNDNRNTYPNDASKNMSSGGISAGPDEQTFFDYFHHHIQSLNYQPPLNNSFNGISLEADRSQLLNLATDIFSEGLPIKVGDTTDPLSGKADDDISLIDFTDAEDLNLDVDGMSNGLKEYVAASEELEFKHDASSADLLEPRTIQDTKPANTITINDLNPDVAFSENVSLPEVNHGIVNTPNQINFLEPIYEKLPKLAENDNSTPCNVIIPELHSQINDILTLQQELDIKGNKNIYAWNAPDAVKSDFFLNHDVVILEDTPTPKEKDLLKVYNISVKEGCPEKGGGPTELGKHDEKDLIDLRLSTNENSIDCKTQVLKQQQTELGELGEIDILLFRSSTDENVNECEAQVFKQDAHEVSDKEVDIITDKFVEDRDIENGCRGIDFAVGCTNNVTNEITDKSEGFDYHLYESDFSKSVSMFKQFNTEGIEKEWQEPNWSLLEGGENDLSPDMALSFSNLRNETSENIKGILNLPNVFNENNTPTEDKYSKNELSLPEGLQKAVANENSILGDLVGQDFKKVHIGNFSLVQEDTEKQLENLKNRMNVSAAELLLEFESLPNKRQELLDTVSSTKQKSREYVTGKKAEVYDSKREIMQQENHEIEIANELQGVSIDKRKGDMQTKEGLAYNKYCIRPTSNKPLTASHKGTNPFRDSQRLKTGAEQCVRIKYTDRNAPRTRREALKLREDNSNNLNSPGNERLHGAIEKAVRQSSVKYPSCRMTIKASYKSDGREHAKPQNKVTQVHSKELSDGNKSPVPSSDINQENVNIRKINSKNYNRPLQKSLYSRKIRNKALSKRYCKPSITLVSDIQEQIPEGSSQNSPSSNTQKVQNQRAAVIGSSQKCIGLSPLETARRNLINRNILLPEPGLDVRQNFRRIRSASKSVERAKRNQSLSGTTRTRPNKKVSFIENENIFAYDPNKSVVENFSKAVTVKINEKKESAVGKEHFVVLGNCEKQDGTSNENPGDTEGYEDLGFVDVPLFYCLPDFESDPPIANVANFGEDDQLLTSSPTPQVVQDRKLSEKLSVVSRKAEGNVRRWVKYGLLARKGISLKKMRAVMSRK